MSGISHHDFKHFFGCCRFKRNAERNKVSFINPANQAIFVVKLHATNGQNHRLAVFAAYKPAKYYDQSI